MRRAIVMVLMHLILLASSAGALASSIPLTLGVHPYLSGTLLYNRFAPLVQTLSAALDRPVRLEISRDYDDHIERTAQGDYDLSFLGPGSYIEMVRRFGLFRILGRFTSVDGPWFTGVIVCREESPLESLADLKGRRFAFCDIHSTMGSLVPQAMLARAGVRLDSLASHVHLGNHDNVALGVLCGDFDAGAVKKEVYEATRERGLRVLARTPEIPEHLLVAGDHVPSETVERFRQILYGLAETAEGKEALAAINSAYVGILPAVDADYNPLRDVLKDLPEGRCQP